MIAPDHSADNGRRRGAEDLIREIKETADRLAADLPARGDLKIISRSIRELRYAFKVFSPYRQRRKVSIFGSARTRSDHPDYLQAMVLGEEMAKQNWMVVTGAASGIMEAGHRGAGREHSLGLNIMLPFEQSANPIILGDPKLVHMKYFFTRKLMFVKECDAVVCLPGGFGTLDEGLEVLTLLQTGKRDMIPVVFLDPPGGDYWQEFHGFITRNLLARGMISPEDLNLYKVTDDWRVTVAEILNFFRVYHSMRYVKQHLVLRLNQPISAELLDSLNAAFAPILAGGRIEQRGPLPEEQDDPGLTELPRLVFQFNRRSLGHLRLMIDSVNAGRVMTGE